jgi:peroxiredoxin
LQARYEDFQAAGAEVLAVSSSSPDEHKKVAEKIGARFPILSDAEGKAMRAYGLLHEDALKPASFDSPVARPAEFVIDGEGVIRARFLTDNWRVRARPEQLLEALERF